MKRKSKARPSKERYLNPESNLIIHIGAIRGDFQQSYRNLEERIANLSLRVEDAIRLMRLDGVGDSLEQLAAQVRRAQLAVVGVDKTPHTRESQEAAARRLAWEVRARTGDTLNIKTPARYATGIFARIRNWFS